MPPRLRRGRTATRGAPPIDRSTPHVRFAHHPSTTDSPHVLTVRTDLSLDGRPQAEELTATVDDVQIATVDRPGTAARQFEFAAIEAFRTETAVGSGFLQARVDGVWVDLLRYSNGLADEFVGVARQLEQLRKGEALEQQDSAIASRRCPTCRLTLQFAGDVCPRCVPRGAVLARTWELLRPYRGATATLFALMVLGLVMELAPPKLQQYLVDNVLDTGGTTAGGDRLITILVIIVGCLAITRLANGVVAALKGVVSSRVGTALTFDLRARLVEKLQQLSVDYYDRHPVGVLMNRVAYDTEALHGLIQQITGGFLLQILQLVGVGCMLFTLNPRLAALTLIPMPLVFGGSWFFWNNVYPRYYRYWDSNSKQAGALTSMLAGIRVVKAFAQEERELERFGRSSNYLRSSRLEVEHSTATFSAVMQLVFSLGGLIVWYAGGRDVLGREMSLGALMAFLAYLAMFYTPFSNLAQLTAWLTSFLTANQRVFELLDTTVRIKDNTAARALDNPQGAVAFDEVSFGYDRRQPVLKQVSFQIKPGEMVGVVGRSGSGKTTLANLLCRFYDVDEGCVSIDGVDVRELDHHDLRRHVGVVLQEPFLFRGTVGANLAYGRPGATPEEIIAAAKAANAHDFILQGALAYDAPLGERGAGLSGGEKQRVSIARALLYDPRILVLDEATSSVDTESERAIQDALRELARGRTTIAIAHRLSTLRDADRILVFDQGRLVEQGSHEELLAADGIYANLVRIQTQLTSEPTIDRLAGEEAPVKSDSRAAANGSPKTEPAERSRYIQLDDADSRLNARTPRAFEPSWLSPANCRLSRDDKETLWLARDATPPTGGVFAVRCFPAERPDEFISLRHADADGQQHELGIIRRMSDWPEAQQALVRDALARRYLLHDIRSIATIRLAHGLLDFEVETDQGMHRFTMRWSQSAVQDFGPRGKLLLDVDDNRWLVADVEALPRRQQLLFRRHVYW